MGEPLSAAVFGCTIAGSRIHTPARSPSGIESVSARGEWPRRFGSNLPTASLLSASSAGGREEQQDRPATLGSKDPAGHSGRKDKSVKQPEIEIAGADDNRLWLLANFHSP
jgi:hypothetical protein